MFYMECSVKTCMVDKDTMITNVPVNLEVCGSFRPSSYSVPNDKFGPASEGPVKPSIEFTCCDATWVFPNNQQRDNEMHLLKMEVNAHRKLQADMMTRLSRIDR